MLQFVELSWLHGVSVPVQLLANEQPFWAVQVVDVVKVVHASGVPVHVVPM